MKSQIFASLLFFFSFIAHTKSINDILKKIEKGSGTSEQCEMLFWQQMNEDFKDFIEFRNEAYYQRALDSTLSTLIRTIYACTDSALKQRYMNFVETKLLKNKFTFSCNCKIWHSCNKRKKEEKHIHRMICSLLAIMYLSCIKFPRGEENQLRKEILKVLQRHINHDFYWQWTEMYATSVLDMTLQCLQGYASFEEITHTRKMMKRILNDLDDGARWEKR